MYSCDGDFDLFSIVSLIGQEYLSVGYNSEAILFLNYAMELDSENLHMKLSVAGALSRAHFEQRNYRKALDCLKLELEYAEHLGKQFIN